MARTKNVKERAAPHGIRDRIRENSKPSGVNKKYLVGRHSQAGKARMDWTGNPHLRVFIHVLRTNFNYDTEMNARIFNRAHSQELKKSGYVDGMPAQQLRDQYDQRGNSQRPTKTWAKITAVNQTPAEMARRQQVVAEIQRIANALALEDAAEDDENEAEVGEDDDEAAKGEEGPQEAADEGGLDYDYEIERQIEDEVGHGAKRRGGRGRRGRVVAAADIDDEDDDELLLVPLAPKPVYGAREQALALSTFAVGQMGSSVMQSSWPATAPTFANSLPQTNVYGNRMGQVGATPMFVGGPSTGFNTSDLLAPPAHINPYLRSNPSDNNIYVSSRTWVNTNRQPQDNATTNEPIASPDFFNDTQGGNLAMTDPQQWAVTTTYPDPYTQNALPINQAHQPTAPPTTQALVPRNNTANNPYTNALNLRPSTLPVFQQPRVPIQPLQMRGVTVDQAYVLEHTECDWEQAENDNGRIRYKVIENDKMWKAWDEFRLWYRRQYGVDLIE